MIEGVGIDIVNVKEFKSLISDKFILKYFSKEEKNLEKQSLAGRFAAREALYKAMNDQKEFKLEDIEITTKGKPQFIFKNSMAIFFSQYRVHLSISNLDSFSIAIVLIEKAI